MHPENTMRNHTPSFVLPAVLLGLSLTSCALARQEEGGASKPARASRQSFAYQSSDGDGHSVELRVEDGRVVTAKVDGKDIPADRVKKAADGYDILDAGGGVMKHVAVAQGAVEERRVVVRGGSSARAQSGSSSSSSGNGTRSESRASGGVRGNGRASAETNGAASHADEQRRSEARSRARIAVGPNGEPMEVREGFPLSEPARIDMRGMDAGFMADPPKSMIGVGLGTPDAAIAHHLRIDPSKATMVTSIVEGLPAEAAGIERFDLIVAVNGDGDASSERLRRVLRDAEPGSKIKLEIRRGGEVRKVEVTAVEFDGAKLAIDVEGFPLGEDFELDAGGGENMMFFIGPDGQRHEMRQGMPMLPGMPAMPNGFDPAQMEQFERAMGEMNRRMEEWGRRMDQRVREQGPDGPRGEQGAGPGGNANDERLRRMEERLDQLMRELERERNANRDRKRDA